MGCIFIISLKNECRIENMGLIKSPCLQLLMFNLYLINLFYVVGPSVNRLNVERSFPSTPNFCSLFEFLATNPLKNQYLRHLSCENCEIKSIKSYSRRAFQQH